MDAMNNRILIEFFDTSFRSIFISTIDALSRELMMVLRVLWVLLWVTVSGRFLDVMGDGFLSG